MTMATKRHPERPDDEGEEAEFALERMPARPEEKAGKGFQGENGPRFPEQPEKHEKDEKPGHGREQKHPPPGDEVLQPSQRQYPCILDEKNGIEHKTERMAPIGGVTGPAL